MSSPGNSFGFRGRMFLIKLLLQCGFDLGNLLVAELALDPADDDFLGEVVEGDHAVGLGRFEPKAAVRVRRIHIVIRRNRVMHGEDHAISGVAFKVGDIPRKSGAHDM